MSTIKKRKLSATTFEDKSENASSSVVAGSSVADFEENWRDNCINVLDTYKYALKKNILTDVTFLVGPESTVCHAHRLILALASPVFQAMFYGGLAEKGETIKIPDITPEGFQHLLRFIYWENKPFEDELDAFQTFIAADKYCVMNLKRGCEVYLEVCPLTICNIWRFLENSIFLNAEKIVKRCLDFLKMNVEDALAHKSFLEVSTKTIETLLITKNLYIDEYRFILRIGHWAEQKCKTEKIGSVQEILSPMLPLFRFGGLTPSEFVTFTEIGGNQNLFTDKDALAILKHLCKPKSCQLPDWCCKDPSRFSRMKFTDAGDVKVAILSDSDEPDTKNSNNGNEMKRKNIEIRFKNFCRPTCNRQYELQSVHSSSSSSSSSCSATSDVSSSSSSDDE